MNKNQQTPTKTLKQSKNTIETIKNIIKLLQEHKKLYPGKVVVLLHPELEEKSHDILLRKKFNSVYVTICGIMKKMVEQNILRDFWESDEKQETPWKRHFYMLK